MRSILREPLLHFLALGAALFLYFHWSGSGSGATGGRIVLTAGQIEHLVAGFAKTRQRPPTEAELKGLIDDWVREEIAVREAMTAGLDRDDTVIRRRLRQKLEFLVEDLSAAVPPTDAELLAWLRGHADAYRVDPRISFRQVFVRREPEAQALLPRLAAAGPDARIDAIGDPTLLPQEVELSPRAAVAATFGPEFAAAVGELRPGAWSGPIASGYGWHLVLVRERIEGSLPDLGAIRSEVERDFLAERRARQIATAYERLLEKYTVVVEGPEARP